MRILLDLLLKEKGLTDRQNDLFQTGRLDQMACLTGCGGRLWDPWQSESSYDRSKKWFQCSLQVNRIYLPQIPPIPPGLFTPFISTQFTPTLFTPEPKKLTTPLVISLRWIFLMDAHPIIGNTFSKLYRKIKWISCRVLALVMRIRQSGHGTVFIKKNEKMANIMPNIFKKQ